MKYILCLKMSHFITQLRTSFTHDIHGKKTKNICINTLHMLTFSIEKYFAMSL